MAQSNIEAKSAGGRPHGLQVKARVVSALIIRSLMEEHGRNNVGFLWIVITPLLLCSGVLVVRSLITSPIDHGVSLIAIIFSGYLPLTLFRHLSNGGVRLLQRNSGLFYHRPISALDTVLAIFAVETISCSAAFIFVYWVLLTVGLLAPIVDYGLVISGWLLMAFLSGAIGCAFAVLTANHDRADRFIQPLQYLILPLCGFFMTDCLVDADRSLL
jgi:capsular polysaccharide transport system permease protein